jgi:hypothetical protein
VETGGSTDQVRLPALVAPVLSGHSLLTNPIEPGEDEAHDHSDRRAVAAGELPVQAVAESDNGER